MKTARTIPHSFLLTSETRPDDIALEYKDDRRWRSLTWKEYFESCARFSTSLKKLDVKKTDRVALYCNTRFEWSITDYAVLGLGAVTVPIYQTITSEELELILKDSQPRVLIIENKSLLRNYQSIKSECPFIEKIIMIDSTDESTLSWKELADAPASAKEIEEYKKNLEQLSPDDMATLIYTSGTTGHPKGVVLNHEQAFSEVSEAFPYAGASSEDVTLTFLPYAHVLGRIEHWGHVYIGYKMVFAESIEKVRSNLATAKPTIMVAVPRIFEKVYASIWAQIESNPAKNKLFRWALSVGLRIGEYRLKKEAPPIALLAQYALAQKLALGKIKEAFGGRLRFAISGGAPLPRDIALFFHACEILILEGYGLTETTAAICVNVPWDYRFGSVGKPIGDVQLKIAGDGEILVKSKKIMKKYYNNPEATAETINSEGWFHTGDIGEIMSNGDLRITDRKKDLIKTAGGKYVAPQRLEGLLKQHPVISQVLIHGDMKKYVVALLTLDKQFVLQIAQDKKISYQDYAQLTQNAAILQAVREAVAQTNTHLASFETIKRFSVLPHEFTIEAGELTPSLKVKRKFCDKKYRQQIEALYN